MEPDILKQNESSWNALAEDFFGVTALPVLGCSIPTEDELKLFPDLNGKAVFGEIKKMAFLIECHLSYTRTDNENTRTVFSKIACSTTAGEHSLISAIFVITAGKNRDVFLALLSSLG